MKLGEIKTHKLIEKIFIPTEMFNLVGSYPHQMVNEYEQAFYNIIDICGNRPNSIISLI